MALSDHDEERLREIARSTEHEDPEFVRTFREEKPAPVRGAGHDDMLWIILGIALFLGGILFRVTPVTILGYALLLYQAVLILRAGVSRRTLLRGY